jgi:hypothetical protein
MGPKRKIQQVEEEEEVVEVEPAPQQAKKKSKKPTTLKEKILDLLSKQTKLIGLATIKKILKEDYEIEDSKANNSRITKTLKELEENGDTATFGKIGGSYHGGEGTAAYQEHAEAEAAKAAKAKFLKDHDGLLQCPYCSHWNDELKSWKGEDSIARGSKFECAECNKKFYTWISDFMDNKVGHKVEYKIGNKKIL